MQALSAVRGNQRVTSDNPEETYDALKKYGTDLVAQARQQWDRTRTFRAALADHQCLEDIDSQLAMLAVWVREQEKADFSALCADTLLRLKAVAEAHALNLSTFF